MTNLEKFSLLCALDSGYDFDIEEAGDFVHFKRKCILKLFTVAKNKQNKLEIVEDFPIDDLSYKNLITLHK